MPATIDAPPKPFAYRDPRMFRGTTRNAPEAMARRRLDEQPYQQLRRVRLKYDEGVLTLDGSVNSYFIKQVAQTAVRGVAGVDKIVNRLEVRYSAFDAADDL
jgi:osmotically-inducible protein OsmY